MSGYPGQQYPPQQGQAYPQQPQQHAYPGQGYPQQPFPQNGQYPPQQGQGYPQYPPQQGQGYHPQPQQPLYQQAPVSQGYQQGYPQAPVYAVPGNAPYPPPQQYQQYQQNQYPNQLYPNQTYPHQQPFPPHQQLQQPVQHQNPSHPFLNPLSVPEIQADVSTLRDATHGIGTNEKKIIAVLSNRSSLQLNQISTAFYQQYNKSLSKVLDGEVSGNFKKLCLALVTLEVEYWVQLIRESVEGIGTNEKLLVETLVGKTNQELQQINMCYASHGWNLLSDIKGDTSGDFEFFLCTLLKGRLESPINTATDVEALYNAGEKKLGTDEKTFINIFCTRTEAHLRGVFAQYQQKYGKTISKVVESEFSGDLEDGLMSIISIVENKAHYIASLFRKAIAGAGTNDALLIRTIVQHRGPYILPGVKAAYQKMFGKSLVDDIKGDCSGDYKRLLVAICDKF